MSTITYAPMPGIVNETKVYSGGLRVGTIRPVAGGFKYYPKGSKRVGGETFASVAAVKRSLEEE